MNNDNLSDQELKKVKWNPLVNKDAITIIKQPDGNYRGFMLKDGNLIQARQYDPGVVLNLLLTHE